MCRKEVGVASDLLKCLFTYQWELVFGTTLYEGISGNTKSNWENTKSCK